MSDTPRPNTPSPLTRYLFVLITGLIIGAIATVMLMRAIEQRQDPFPGSLMHVMAKQSQLLRQSQSQNRCSVAETAPRLQTLRYLTNDLDHGFSRLRDDSRFQAHASQLRATLNQALAAPPQDCTTLAKVAEQIGNDCKACHQDFR